LALGKTPYWGVTRAPFFEVGKGPGLIGKAKTSSLKTNVVTAVVNAIIMPAIGRQWWHEFRRPLTQPRIRPNWPKTVRLSNPCSTEEAGAAVIAYGSFINMVIDFSIPCLLRFMIVKVMNTLKKKPVRVAQLRPRTCQGGEVTGRREEL
jgi:large-conductance mechanosensitive channel